MRAELRTDYRVVSLALAKRTQADQKLCIRELLWRVDRSRRVCRGLYELFPSLDWLASRHQPQCRSARESQAISGYPLP